MATGKSPRQGRGSKARASSGPRPRRTRPLAALQGHARRNNARAADQADVLALFENASDIMLLNDRDGRIVMANLAAREFGGYSAAEVAKGVWLRDVLPAADCDAAMLLTARALDGLPVPGVYEREAVLRDGRRRILELRSNVVQLSGGERLLQTIGRDVTESRRVAAFQASLVQVSQTLLTAQKVEDLSVLICEEVRRVLAVDGVYLWLKRGDELVGVASAGVGADPFLGLRRSMADSLIGRIFAAGEVVVVNDLQQATIDAPLSKAMGMQSALGIPLHRHGEKLGVLSFCSMSDAHYFDGAVCERAMILAAQTAVAIGSALAREREEEEGHVSAALLQVARAIRESLEEAEVLERIVSSARDVLRCDWTVVSLWNSATRSLQVAAGDGFPQPLLEEMRVVEIRPELFAELAPVLAHQPYEVSEPGGAAAALYERWQISSFLGIPMVHAGELIGSFGFGYRQRRGPFSRLERRIAEGVAAQTAVAVDNARLVEHLRRANKLKTEFLGTMSHELRTPLSAMLGYTELLREGIMGALTSEQGQALDRMLINGRGLLELVNTTLDVNRLEAGRVTVDMARFAVAELMAELRTEYSARPLERGLVLQWPDVPARLTLHSDRNKLKIILRNLIDNAIKYTMTGSIRIEVAIGDRDERVRFSVQDTGVGIPPEAQQSIFEMFHQLDHQGSPPRSGVGLGLYLVRRYAQLLNGEISVESVTGLGSTFAIDLPLQG